MAVLVVVSVFDNCCKRLLLDWTLWEADKWKIEELYSAKFEDACVYCSGPVNPWSDQEPFMLSAKHVKIRTKSLIQGRVRPRCS